MSTGHRPRREDPEIIALVELDMQKMWLRIFLAGKTIRKRMRELEDPHETCRTNQGFDLRVKQMDATRGQISSDD
jgi:hypothetical protein